MQTANSIYIAAPLERIVQLAYEVERWPELLPHYRWVTVLSREGNRKTVEMAARRGRFPVKWRAVQDLDQSGPTPVVRFRHIGGVTRGMEVAWTFAPDAHGVKVRIDHDFAPPWPVVGNFVANRIIGPMFIANIAGRTLAHIKAIAEAASNEPVAATSPVMAHQPEGGT